MIRALREQKPIIAYLILVAAIIVAFIRVEDVRQERREISNEAIVISCERVDRVLGELVKSVPPPEVSPNAPDPGFQSGSKDALRALRETSCRDLGRTATENSGTE